MDVQQIKLVAADMDGTLLNSRHELSDKFYPIFRALQVRGIRFAAASGRQYYNLLHLFEPIRDEVIFIAENGSYVVHGGVDILVQALEQGAAREQLRLAKTIPGTYAVLCGKKRAYVEDTHAPFMAQVKLYYDKFAVVDDLLRVEDDQFLKIAIFDTAGAEANSYPYFGQSKAFLQVKVSGSSWLDISHQLANKGRALEVVQRRYGITVEQTLAFGDYLNDVEMMGQAYYSFAMANAHPLLKAAARFTAKSNDQNGVLEIMQGLIV